MLKVASPTELLTELRAIMAYARTGKPQRSRLAAQLHMLADRVGGLVRIGSYGKPLYGYTDMNNSYLVDDYPYGRMLRCKIRYWIESDPRKGYRFCSQTQDPRNGRWNNPKKSTYALLGGCMYLDSKEHVQWAAISEYSKDEDVLEFVKAFPQADFKILKIFTAKKIEYLRAGTEGKLVWRINGVPQPITEEDMGRYKRELETWEDIAKIVR